ncbi:hypothetical protein ABGV42_05675 [Paenibacillus pabuli]|uniref:hypothetical protein n=1 Tax=Paenibacillus pabuli TaxID=1472 RepID=UPI0032420836
MGIEDIILTCIKEHPEISAKKIVSFLDSRFISNGRNEFTSFYFKKIKDPEEKREPS